MLLLTIVATCLAIWHRWHISLSSWLRDYLYIPLGGSRVAPAVVYVNLMVTMLLGGLWHGASWNFVLWGTMHGVALCLHRLWRSAGGRLPAMFAWPLTFLFVLITWVPFRSGDFQHSRDYFSGLLSGEGVVWLMPQVVVLLLMVTVVHAVMATKPERVGQWHCRYPIMPNSFML